jgi:hypothetical protein
MAALSSVTRPGRPPRPSVASGLSKLRMDYCLKTRGDLAAPGPVALVDDRRAESSDEDRHTLGDAFWVAKVAWRGRCKVLTDYRTTST